MKKTSMAVLPVLAAVFAAAPAVAQDRFEGSVTYRMTGPDGQAMQMVHHVRGDDIRMDMNMQGQSISMITDLAGTKQIVLMHAMRQWMDAKAMQERMGGMMPPGMAEGGQREVKPPSDLNMRATGRKETIAGHECEHYVFTADGGEVDICAARGLGWYFGTPTGGGGMAGMGGGRGTGGGQGVPGLSNAQLAQWRELHADGFFPLQISVSGATPLTLTVTELVRTRPAESLFRAPAEYSEMRIGG
jgi:hypothetical protein